MLVNSIRKIFYPFSLLYGLIVHIRNKAFDLQILKSRSFDLPVITIGNLNVGGTGKSPMIEYVIRLCADTLDIAVLSRGYGRKSKGFLLASPTCSARDIGDEPYQFYLKFKKVKVAVDADRVKGIETLLHRFPSLDLILLDDAFQHRYVNAGMQILLTAYSDLYTEDLILPAGGLRESRKGAKRADVIVVSKCPQDISVPERVEITRKIAPTDAQELFFSTIAYDDFVYSEKDKISISELVNWRILLVTGIANPKPLETFLKRQEIAFEHLKLSDHQFIDTQVKQDIQHRLKAYGESKKLILTTEKDFVRNFMSFELPVYYLPIRTKIIDEEKKFNKIIETYVRKD